MPVATHEVAQRKPPRGYSEVTSGAGLIAVSGQLASEEVLAGESGFADQFASAMARLMEALSTVGAGPNDILLMRIYVTDVDEYHDSIRDLGPAYKENFDSQYPATTLVGVSALIDNRAKVEIEALAAQP